jgi:hypothetical protein
MFTHDASLRICPCRSCRDDAIMNPYDRGHPAGDFFTRVTESLTVFKLLYVMRIIDRGFCQIGLRLRRFVEL